MNIKTLARIFFQMYSLINLGIRNITSMQLRSGGNRGKLIHYERVSFGTVAP